MVTTNLVAAAHKKAKKIRETFTAKSAVSPETALTLEELGLRDKSIFQLMILKKFIVKLEDKYYFDAEKYDDKTEQQIREFISGLLDDLKE